LEQNKIMLDNLQAALSLSGACSWPTENIPVPSELHTSS
jgi:hypothetical protein